MHQSLILILTIFSCISLVFGSIGRPNFILFLTDDQDLLLDGMVPMQQTIKHVANEGLTFQNAHVHSPICCPSRSSLLTGKYLHNINVKNNSLDGNCASQEWRQQHEPKSMAAILKREAGYVNFYAGKYLNQYGSHNVDVPPGYDWWYGLQGNSKYYNFSLSINGSKVHFKDAYLTDLMKVFAKDFLHNVDRKQPFFMVLATPAAHAPFTPAERHKEHFPDVKAVRTPAFNASAIDKHWLLNLPPHNLPSNVAVLDAIQRKRMQTLLAVDELVDFTVTKLKELGMFTETYLIFTSDNGYHIGQFALPWDKRQPYQTDINVPLLIRGPGVPKKKLIANPVSLVDLAPTILDLAHVAVPEDMDGQSFRHLIETKTDKLKKTARKLIFIEYFGEGNAKSVQKECNFPGESVNNLSECSLENWCKCQDSRNNTYSCVLEFDNSSIFKFCSFQDDLNFIEAYNITNDLYELTNLGKSLNPEKRQYYHQLIAQYKKCHGSSCHSIAAGF